MKTNVTFWILCIVLTLITSACLTISADNYPPMFKAAESGDIALAEKLIQNCESVNQTTVGMQTPLHIAAESGNNKMVHWLLAREADPLAKDQNGKTPFDFATEQGQADSSYMLKMYVEVKKEEADYYQQSQFGLLRLVLFGSDYRRLDLLHYLAEIGDVSNLANEIQETKNIDPVSIAGKTPLHFAVIARQLNSLKVLLDAGANPNIGDMYNKTPLYYAVELGDMDMVAALLDHGGDPSISSVCNNNENIMGLAKRLGNKEIITLIEK